MADAVRVWIGGATTTVNDLYQLGHITEQTDGSGTVLARYSYDSAGVPTSVQVGRDPATAPTKPESPREPPMDPCP